MKAPERSRRLTRSELAEFTDFLGTMLDEGIPLSEAVEQCAQLFQGRPLGHFSLRVVQGLAGGKALAQTIADDPAIVDGRLFRFVVVGERSGNLGEALKQTTAHLHRRDQLRHQLVSSLTYPVAVLAFLVVALVLVLHLLLPRIEEAADPTGTTQNPVLTQLGSTLRVEAATGAAVLALGTAIALLPALATRFSSLRRILSPLVLSLPLLGRTVCLAQFSAFVSAIESLVRAGSSIEDSVVESATLLSNPVLRFAVNRACDKLSAGIGMSAALRTESSIPRRIADTIAVAERTGKTQDVLRSLKSLYEWEYDRRLKRMSALAEPALLSISGGAVLVVVLTVFLPLVGAVTNVVW